MRTLGRNICQRGISAGTRPVEAQDGRKADAGGRAAADGLQHHRRRPPDRSTGRGATGAVVPAAAHQHRTAEPAEPYQVGHPEPAGRRHPLPPDDNGYVFIETKSGRTRCQISSSQVDCEAQFTNTPLKDGQHANGVSVSAEGTVQWVLGNLGDIPVVTIDYLTYQAQGWTINADINGTRFTNDRSGHGMLVSVDNVDTF